MGPKEVGQKSFGPLKREGGNLPLVAHMIAVQLLQ